MSEFVDSRANSTGEISVENSVPGPTAAEIAVGSPALLPPGLTVLSPEEVEAKTDAVPEEVDEAQAKKMIDEAYAKAEGQEASIKKALEGLGSYVLIRFEHPMSLRHTLTFPTEGRPATRALLAVFRERAQELETYEMRRVWSTADRLDAQQAVAEQDEMIRGEAIKRGLPLNRATFRKLRGEMFGFEK